jgi:hypothetical protein
LFSSASRAVDVSTSKMPPQQPDRLLDLFDKSLDFRAHAWFHVSVMTRPDVTAPRASRKA